MSTDLSPSIMSGSYDFPPATATQASMLEERRPTTVDPRRTTHAPVDSYRGEQDQIDRRREQLLQRTLVDSEYRHYNAARGSTRRQHLEDHAAGSQNLTSNSSTRHRTPGARLRRRVTGGNSTHPHRPFYTIAPGSLGLDSPAPPQLPQISNPDMTSAEYLGEAEVNRRRKRVKLSEDHASARYKSFKYDWCGRARPGPLKMEIQECDGGIHFEVSAQDCHQYKQENVLVNDQSVYCTESNQCNITLRHVGEACFTLTKIVIKAPERGFTAPVQEGLVFVGMDANELVLRTFKYRLLAGSKRDHALESHSRHSSQDSSELRRPPSRRRDSLARSVPPPISDTVPRIRAIQGADFPLDLPQDCIDRIAPTVPSQGFRVTTHCNEVSDDEEQESSAQTLADRYQREHMPGSLFPAGSDDEEDSRAICRRNGKRRDSPSDIDLPSDRNPNPVLTPLAKFFIEKDRSVVSIAFDPPVAGKYILLKLFGPHEHQNIDIQSINVHGFAGPRLFPAIELL